MNLKYLTVTLEPKAVSVTEQDQGVFTGLASVYRVVDRVNDVVVPGAFKRSIASNGGRVPLLWQHDQRTPIGVCQLKDGDAGLAVSGRLVLQVPQAAIAWQLMKAGVIDSLSIGYDTVRASVNQQGVRELHELKLWEVSLVTIPANPLATVSDMKHADVASLAGFRELIADVSTFTAEVRLRALLRQMRDARA